MRFVFSASRPRQYNAAGRTALYKICRRPVRWRSAQFSFEGPRYRSASKLLYLALHAVNSQRYDPALVAPCRRGEVLQIARADLQQAPRSPAPPRAVNASPVGRGAPLAPEQRGDQGSGIFAGVAELGDIPVSEASRGALNASWRKVSNRGLCCVQERGHRCRVRQNVLAAPA